MGRTFFLIANLMQPTVVVPPLSRGAGLDKEVLEQVGRLSRHSTAVKRQHDQDDSYKRDRLIGGLLAVSEG